MRGEGGYIVAAPSLHISGRRYEWLNNLKPAEAPEWLIKRLTEEKQAAHKARLRKKRSHAPQAAHGSAL